MSNYQTKDILSKINTKAKRLLLLLSFFILLASQSFAQQIDIKAENIPLNELFYQLIEAYNIQISFNDKLLGNEMLTMNMSFPDLSSALDLLLVNRDLSYAKQGDIYVIIKDRPVSYYLSCFIQDKHSLEALPFAHILINKSKLISDVNGKFSLQSKDSLFHLKIQYLGYFILDTTLVQGKHQLGLQTSIHGLSEVTIKGEKIEKSMEVGEAPGKIRLNHQTAKHIPGNGDNSVFNYLRLQPGILAAGEQSGDLIIWGGYEGHSKVIFDGYTIYGLKNFNDNISAINPYMAKDIMVLKGGYGPEYGNRVGGIVDITGFEGSKTSPEINLNINNMTMSGMASVPLTSNSAFMIAFRRTYYNLYDAEDFPFNARPSASNQTDIEIFPEYTFGDMNLKYAGNTDKLGTYYISYYSGKDDFNYDLSKENDFTKVEQNAAEANTQKGGSLYWGKEIKPGLHTDILASYSNLNSKVELNQSFSRIRTSEIIRDRENSSGNTISETGIINRYYFTKGDRVQNQIQAGIGYNYNKINLLTEEWEEELISIYNKSGRIEAYLFDHITLGDYLTLVPGLRLDIPLALEKAYLQPRFSIRLKPTQALNLYLAWGIYNQFMSKTSVLDDNGNYQYFWALSDNIEVPVLSASHYVAGLSLKNNFLTLSGEGYFKTTEGITRYVNQVREGTINIYEGDGRSYGADLLLKGRMKKHEAWIAYSFSSSLEYFPYFYEDEYRYAPQDQRHEIKTSLLLNFSPIHLSANYIYGSGFMKKVNQLDTERVPYNRVDVSTYYNFSFNDYTFEAGISILNLFNTENIKYANFIRVPVDQLSSINIHAEAVPFTPTIFLNLAF